MVTEVDAQGNLLQTVSIEFFTKLQNTYKVFRESYSEPSVTTEQFIEFVKQDQEWDQEEMEMLNSLVDN